MADYRSWRNARYHCAICQRPFDRRDVLSRHMQVHGGQRVPPKPRRRACVSCSQSKIRCNGQRPSCATCQRRDRECVWAEPPVQGVIPDHGDIDVFGQSLLDPTLHVTPSPSGGDASSSTPKSTAGGAPVQQEVYQSESMPHVTLGQHKFGNESLLPDMQEASLSELGLSSWQGIDFTSALDWVWTLDTGDDIAPTTEVSGAVMGPELYDHQLFVMSAPQTTSNSAKQSEAGDGIAPDEARGPMPTINSLLAPQPQESRGHGELWPLAQPGPPMYHYSLPSLHSSGWEPSTHDQFNSIMSINDRTWHALQRCLRLPFEHYSLQMLDLGNFPTADKLDHCIDMFFTHFQPMLPIIHEATFDPGKDLLVTLAMVVIGACYTDFDEALSFSTALSDLIRRLLVFTAEHDHRFVRSVPYVTAQLLQGVHGYCSGSHRLFELSEASRSALVHRAKCMGVFEYQTPPPIQPSASPEETWQRWIAAETLRRLGWAIYKYDASVSYLHNNRPFLTIRDVQLALPSSSSHWAARTATAWASLHPWCKTLPSGPRLLPTIKKLFQDSDGSLDKNSDEEHTFLVTLTLLRMLWSQNEIGVHDLQKHPTQDDGREIILRAMDRMAVPVLDLEGTHTGPEIERIVHRMQLIHFAHIYGAGDLMNWLYPYLRNGQEAEYAKIRMRQWAVENPQKVREAAYHSAQLLALARHYPNNMPLHGFIVFHAGVVLVCTAVVLRQTNVLRKTTALQLDDLAAESKNRQESWIKTGGDERVGLFGVASLCCAKGRLGVLDQTATLLKQQKSWGMARNLTKLVLSLRLRDAIKNEQDPSAWS